MSNYRACGKQVLRDREHVADAADETYAQIIVDALNGTRQIDPLHEIGVPACDVGEVASRTIDLDGCTTFDQARRLAEYHDPMIPQPTAETAHEWDTEFSGEPPPMEQLMPDDPHSFEPIKEPHNVTTHVDGSMSCICGRRWDRDDGYDCPGDVS